MDLASKFRPRWPWVLWALTTLFSLSMALLMAGLLRAATIQYHIMEIKQLPLLTEWAFDWIPNLWLGCLAGSLVGAGLMLKKGSQIGQAWALFMLVILLTTCASLTFGLILPFTKANYSGLNGP